MALSRINKFVRQNFFSRGATRGHGVLERFLALQRVRMARRCITRYAGKAADGSLVDMGCGAYPINLLTSGFAQKYGLDKFQGADSRVYRRFQFRAYDLEQGGVLPFSDGQIDVVTMLAVFEHIRPERLGAIFGEIHRILKPGGICVITTPATWSDGILKILSRIHMVSAEEIDDHKNNLSRQAIGAVLKQAGFERIHAGYFECFLNRWFVVIKA